MLPGGENRAVTRRFNARSIAVLAVVVTVLTALIGLLALTLVTTRRIEAKTERIALTGRGINTATDSIVQLRRAHRSVAAILDATVPIAAKVERIAQLVRSIQTITLSVRSSARGIETSVTGMRPAAASIQASADSLSGSIEGIHDTARETDRALGGILASMIAVGARTTRIDAVTAGIAGVAAGIDRDISIINLELDETIGIQRAVRGITQDLLRGVQAANRHAACIDRKLYGRAGDNGDCP